MRDSVLVLVANEKYLPFAKRLFGNAVSAGNWKGDLLLITNDENIKPFTINSRDVQVKNVRAIEDSDFSWTMYNPIVWNKLNIFEEDMKRWEHIVYLDCDITIQGDINKLSRVKTFCAVPYDAYRLNALFLNRESPIYKELLKNFDLNVVPLNSGVMAFPSSIINKNTFEDMIALYRKYKYIMYSDDEVLNLFFYKKWKKLKITYSYDLEHYRDYLIKNKPPRIIHYVHDKTWQDVFDHGYGAATTWQDYLYELIKIRIYIKSFFVRFKNKLIKLIAKFLCLDGGAAVKRK
jgi:lipopolysaccharide biosynthesis glycosyltransferase